MFSYFNIFYRTKLLSTFDHPSAVYSVALQPGSNGNVCATACQDGIIRLFDTRRNQTGGFFFETTLSFSTILNKFIPFIRCFSADWRNPSKTTFFDDVFTCRAIDRCCGLKSRCKFFRHSKHQKVNYLHNYFLFSFSSFLIFIF